MSQALKYHRGQPDQPGWWWLWPDEKFCKETGAPDGPSIIEVRMQSDITIKPELHMLYRGFRLEAWLFKGRVAGPIPEPEIKERTLAEYAKLAESKNCISCNRPLSLPIKVEYYSHQDGRRVEGLHDLQWLFVICTRRSRRKCNFQNSFDSLGIKR